jgi:opacity protein-like surface antigen/outer membrane receptor protein involved in Fe transport
MFAPLGTAPTTLSREAIESLPQGTNTPVDKVLLQLPGVTQDTAASGGLHVRNEHANVSYRINGILMPDGLGAFGPFLDTSFVGSLTLITGALPAQFGLRTAGIVDIKTATFDNSGQIGVYGGSRQTINSNIQYGGKTGSTEYFFTGRYLQNILGIENTTPLINAIHDRTQQDRSFAYVSTIIDPTTRVSFIGGIANNRFQIPDTPGIFPSFTAYGLTYFDSSKVNENQKDSYKFGVLALQKSVNDVDLQLAYFTRSSFVEFTPDPIADLMFNGVATKVYRGSVVNGIQGDSAFRLNDVHTVRAGIFASAEKTNVSGVSQLLPLDATTGAQILPDVPFTAIDSSVLLGWLGGVYVQDEWKLTDRLTLNTGARFDQMWQYQNANQLSPRVSLTYQPFAATTFHAGFARTFTPPVQVIAAPTNTALFTSCPGIPNCTTIQAPAVPPPYAPFEPERASIYDIGVTQKVLPGLEVGVDVYLKTARALIDDGQFGAALVLNGFNYDRAQNTGVELKATYTNGGFRAYANWAWANQRATNITSNQYLFGADELAYIRNNWIYTDHSQVWTGSGGVSYLWNGTRFSTDIIYGSGLRSGDFNTDHNAPYAQVNAGLSREFNIPGWNPVIARFDVVNVFDVSYALRDGTGIGVFARQFGPRRGYYFGLAQKFGPGANKPATAVAPAYLPGYWVPVAPPQAYMASRTSKDAIEAVWSWAGFYIGGNLGYSLSRFSTDTSYSDASLNTPLAATTSSMKHYGALGGGQAGFNWQWGAWVAGIETDMQFAHQRTRTASVCAGVICNPAVPFEAPVTLIHQHNLDWFGTVRGRFGVAVTPHLLTYVTGGLAYGEVEHVGTIYGIGVDAFGNFIDNGNNFVSRQTRAGWTAGAGLEARLAGNVTGKIEYLHADLGTESAQGVSPLNVRPITVDFRSRITEDLVRVGLNYKFDPYVGVYTSAAAITPAARERPRVIYKAPITALWTWTGFYFGANAGYATGSFSADTLLSDATVGTPLLAGHSSSRLTGGTGGVQAGYNWQLGTWLAGIETDIAFTTQRNTSGLTCPAAICNPGMVGLDAPVGLLHSHNLDWFGTVRGRFGAVITPNAVAYVTGGLAVGAIAHSIDVIGVALDANGNPSAAPVNFVSRTAKPGWVAGAGIEARLAGNVTGKIEYLHMDFGSNSAVGINNQNALPITFAVNSRVTEDVIRLGVNYKFDPNAVIPTYQPATPDKPRMTYKGPVQALWAWTGYYIGLNSGYSWGKSRTDALFKDAFLGTAFATSSSITIDGKVFGIQTGYNFQIGSWLWGIEADTQLTAQHANPKFVCPNGICNPAGPVVAAFDQSQHLEWFGTLRARLGALVTPAAMVYVTGGAAVTGLRTAGTLFGFDMTGAPLTNSFSNITINAGWTGGGGVEARLCGNWTGKVEYLYVTLGSMTTNLNNQDSGMTLTTTFNSRLVDQVLRAGLNYKFD